MYDLRMVSQVIPHRLVDVRLISHGDLPEFFIHLIHDLPPHEVIEREGPRTITFSFGPAQVHKIGHGDFEAWRRFQTLPP